MRVEMAKLWQRRAVILVMLCLAILAPACRKRGTALLEQGQVAWDNSNFEVAAARYEDYLKEDIRSAQAETARFKLANLYLYNLKKYDLATQHYIHLLEAFRNPARTCWRVSGWQKVIEAQKIIGRQFRSWKIY